MTLKEYIKGIEDFVKQYPEALDMPVIYASNDEGNSYHTIYNTPTIIQVHSLEGRDLEVVGYYSSDNRLIAREDCNAVIIN